MARSVVLVSVLVSSLLGCKAFSKLTDDGAADKGDAGAPVTAAAAPSAAPTTSDVSFTKKVPKPGTKGATTRKTASKFTMGGKTFRENSFMQGDFVVKESDEFRVTKASLDVKELYTTSQEGTGSEKRSVSPLAGSSYIVTRGEDGKLSAQDSGGNKVPATTLKLIKDEFGSSFEKNQDAAFLPDRPLKLEEKLMPASDSMLRALGIKDDGNTVIDGTEFFLRSVANGRAKFDATMTMTQKIPAAGLRVRAKLGGNLEMVTDGAWIVAIDLKGPITILDGSGNEKGSGDLSITGTQTFE
ncbi:MAG TPA: hypothetical protein VFU02_13830 [Polyangiaceae bacterium]|nr:hypothetical protein [Polyangiaceae bacterium]